MKSRMKLTREKEYKIFCEQVEFVTRSTVLVILYILYQKGWHKDKIEKLYDEICEFYTSPPIVFGKEINDLYIQEYMTKHFDMDLEKLKLTIASERESQKIVNEVENRRK